MRITLALVPFWVACAATGGPPAPGLESVRSALEAYEAGLQAAAASDDPAAIEHFTRALAFDARFSQALVARAMAHARLGRHAQAEFDYARAIEVAGPRCGKWLYARARYHHERGQLEQAERDYDAALEALRRAPDNSLLDVYLHRALLYQDTGRTQKAAEDYRAALRLQPDPETAAAIQAWLARVSSR